MKAICLHRPWADWVLLGWKTVETRTHPRFKSLANLRIAICASQKWDATAIDQAREWLTESQIQITQARQTMPIGGTILCTAHVVNFMSRLHPIWESEALIECATNRTGLLLEAVKPIEPPIPVKGRQGIFNVELDKPARVTLSRRKGWKMPANTVRVTRPGKFGNPFLITKERGQAEAVTAFNTWLRVEGCDARIPEKKKAILDGLAELRGKNLACWCKQGTPCHADVLLELANKEASL